MDLVRWSTPDEMCMLGSSDKFVVTDEATDEYNCLGFCLSLKWSYGWPLNQIGEQRLKTLGGRPALTPSDSDGDITIALYDGQGRSRDPQRPHLAVGDGLPHVAKYLGRGWYESKCGPGIRMVHRLSDEAIVGLYGRFAGLWVLNGEAAFQQLLREGYDLNSLQVIEHFSPDSLRRLEEMLAELPKSRE